ncbi:hypothetical protein GCM10022288_08420 [Gryllotalpicola kribbensis]|uniref:Uncharacterized protein n=1 Tax=Gryllotalpicola kribbensis TaxID=993084 RepID=A0ABP8AM21_9MICO
MRLVRETRLRPVHPELKARADEFPRPVEQVREQLAHDAQGDGCLEPAALDG